MFDFIPQFIPQIRPEDIEAVQQQMLSGWVGTSKTTITFEEAIKQITGAKHCISTTSGTTAIILALNALGLSKNSNILFPAYTFLAGANACCLLGYRVQLVDIKLETLCMDPVLIEQAIKQDCIDCVMFINHNAYVGEDVQIIKGLCDQCGIPMFEDACQALGIPNAGRTGKVGVFSFSVPKLITTGQGGVIITDDDRIADRCRAMRDHGGNDWRRTRIHKQIGGNFKFNDILAAYGLSQLQDLDKLLIQRKAIFDRYRLYLNIYDYGYDSTWMVIYYSNHADEIIETLASENIQAVKYYRPINNNPPYHTKINFPITEQIYENTIYLPSSLNLQSKQIDRICRVILQVEREKNE